MEENPFFIVYAFLQLHFFFYHMYVIFILIKKSNHTQR